MGDLGTEIGSSGEISGVELECATLGEYGTEVESYGDM